MYVFLCMNGLVGCFSPWFWLFFFMVFVVFLVGFAPGFRTLIVLQHTMDADAGICSVVEKLYYMDQRHCVEFLFFILLRKKLTTNNLVNLGQSSTHHGKNCPDFRC